MDRATEGKITLEHGVKNINQIVAFWLIAGLAAAQSSIPPASGFVPDEKTAIEVGVAIMTPIFGKEHLQKERPFVATLRGDTWTVHGSLPKARRSGEIVVGGTATIELSKTDGHVLQVWHSK